MADLETLSPTELFKLPPSVLDSLPALSPPPGVESNFVNPEDRGYILKSVATVLFCFMVCFFANRVYTKLFIIRKLGWDDLSCTIGFLGSIGMYIVTLWSTILGPVGKHQWDVRFIDYVNGNYIIVSTIIVFLFPFTLLFIKLTFFLLYFQVFQPLRWLRISVYIGTSLTCAFYGAVSIVQIVFTTPKPGETWLEQDFSGRGLKAEVLSVSQAVVGLVIDLVLLVMPIVAVQGLQMPTKRKIGIMVIFTVGIFACIGSLLSIYYRVVQEHSPDITWNSMPVELMGLVEQFIGVSCASMPAFSRMLRHHLPALKKVRSALFPQFVRLRSSRLGDTTGRYGLSQSTGPIHNPMMKTKPGPYSHREVEVSSPGNATFQPTYELGQLQSVQTFIGKGRKKGTSDDKIHLTHEIRQQQVRTD